MNRDFFKITSPFKAFFYTRHFFATFPKIGIVLGMTGYTIIWPLFGAANQLLAALTLLAVCAWLGNAGKNNKMFYIPMVFILAVTLTSLVQTLYAKGLVLMAGTGDLFSAGVQAVLSAILFILAICSCRQGR